jgi:3-isopropylmalate/(R)-2-methylmalate dehydratase large subunit
MVVPVTSLFRIREARARDRQAAERALEYMALEPRTSIQDIAIDRAFIGSCTNARIEDLRAAARVVKGYRINSSVSAMVVPGSQDVKTRAEREGSIAFFMKRVLSGAKRMLDVSWDECRHLAAGRALCVDE